MGASSKRSLQTAGGPSMRWNCTEGYMVWKVTVGNKTSPSASETDPAGEVSAGL